MANEPIDDRKAQVELDVAGLTDVGHERERNEDQYLIAAMERTLSVEDTSLSHQAIGWLPRSVRGCILLVADGMGGAGGGDIASAVAVRAIAEYLCTVMPLATSSAPASVPSSSSSRSSEVRESTVPGVRHGLKSAIERGDAEVRRAAQASGEEKMGTTLTMAYILWPQLYVAHVGDSRAYLLRDRVLVRLTTDHTYAEKLREQTKVALDASSPWHHVLWNALGGNRSDQVEPELHRWALEAGDVVMLCSDGLTKHVTDESVARVLRKAERADTACSRLVTMANAGGGTDNTTVVVARCVSAGSASDAVPTLKRAPKSRRRK